jgi:hypothetical protein
MRCKVAAACLSAALLCACGPQFKESVDVGIGVASYVGKKGAIYAALYKPYAQMSALVYTDAQFMTSDGQGCPDVKKLRDPTLADANHRAADNVALADWLDELQAGGRWICVRSHSGAVGCPVGIECAGGLQVMAWKRRDCEEVVIAFRGTDKEDRGDWASNLRLLVFRPLFDQYDQVEKVIANAVDRIEHAGCQPRHIIATGHSLGGGLAQQAAFAEPRIDYVYAFNPSPIAGFFNVAADQRMRNVETLGIDRIYEAGEVLSLTRYLSSAVYATAQCRPRIRTVRFATLGGSRIERHSIIGLTKGMVELSKMAAPQSVLPYGFERAHDCDLATEDFGG